MIRKETHKAQSGRGHTEGRNDREEQKVELSQCFSWSLCVPGDISAERSWVGSSPRTKNSVVESFQIGVNTKL